MKPCAFPKNFRLLRRSEFRQVYDEGQRRASPLCSAFFHPNGLGVTRLGITTPVRLGSAVVRNRVKRRLREVFRLQRTAIPAGWDIVLNPRGTVAKLSFKELTREILRLFPASPPATAASFEPKPKGEG